MRSSSLFNSITARAIVRSLALLPMGVHLAPDLLQETPLCAPDLPVGLQQRGKLFQMAAQPRDLLGHVAAIGKECDLRDTRSSFRSSSSPASQALHQLLAVICRHLRRACDDHLDLTVQQLAALDKIHHERLAFLRPHRRKRPQRLNAA